jgi:hypothetical protein
VKYSHVWHPSAGCQISFIGYALKLCAYEERIKRLKNSKVKTIPILQYDENKNLVKEWASVNSIKGFSKHKIKKCLKDKTYFSENYIWKYKYPELVS